MYRKKTITIISTAVVFFIYGCASSNEKNKEAWQPLFNGKDLTGWDIKIKDHSLNENYKNTFLVEDSMIRVTYAGYDKFDNQFGHLYTQTPYSCYKLKLQYRFTGNHLADAPAWGRQEQWYYAAFSTGKKYGTAPEFSGIIRISISLWRWKRYSANRQCMHTRHFH